MSPTTKNSIVPVQITPMNLRIVGHVLIDSKEEDETIDIGDYEDVRIEMLATGHHLTSVLINPRETLMQNLFDEFANEQSLPLEYQPGFLSSTMSASQHMFGLSTHSSHTTTATSSSDGPISSHSRSSRSMANADSSMFSHLISLTQTEMDQLNRFIVKINKLYEIYASAHPDLDHRFPRQSKAATLSNDLTQSPHHSSSKAKRLANEEVRYCYREVPEIFFRTDFTLSRQEIFNQALLSFEMDRSESFDSIDLQRSDGDEEGLKRTSQSKTGKKSPRLQDKLSVYLDLVEVALLRQIWSRSPAFFRALDDLKGLQYEVHEAIQILLLLRRKLFTLNEKRIKQSLVVPKLSQRQRNMAALQQKLQYMRQLIEGRSMIVTLLECEDYYSALELIYSIKDIYFQHLKDVEAIKVVGNQLQEFQVVICEVLCNKFATFGIQWEDEGRENRRSDRKSETDSSFDDIMNELNSLTSSSGVLTSSSEKRHQLIIEQKQETKRLVLSLVATDQFYTALNMYRNRLVDGIKLIIRTCVMEYMNGFDFDSSAYEEPLMSSTNATSPGASESSDTTPFVQKVREMESESFLSCLSMCFEHLNLSLKKAHAFHTFLYECIQSLNTQTEEHSRRQVEKDYLSPLESPVLPDSSSSSFLDSCISKLDEKAIIEITEISKSAVFSACEIVQKSIIQFINFRKDINAKFAMDKMIFLWEICLQFVKDLEYANFNSNAFAFRQCLLMQTKLFLDYLHEQSKNRLVSTLDAERWVQADVSVERQGEIDRLSSGKTFLSNKSTPNSSSNPESSTTMSSQGSKKGRDKEIRTAVVETKEYKVVWSVLLLIEIILAYLDIAIHFSAVTNDILHKSVELIRLFNTRTKQLVLGAQAIQSAARLKSISAKHLAMTGQSLALFINLLPHIRAALLAQIPSTKQNILSTELDRVSHDLFEHHALIMSKFVTIVSDMIEQFAISKLKSIDWDRVLEPSNVPSQSTENNTNTNSSQSDYFEEIQRNIITLHKVLINILPPEQIQDIFTRIFALLNRKLVHHFEEIMPTTPYGRQRILDEITTLVASLSRLKSVEVSVLINQLEDSFRKKYTQT
eukprot:gene6829-7360_t